MKRNFPSFLSRSAQLAAAIGTARPRSARLGPHLARALAPVLAAYLFVGTCGGGRSGFVLALKAGKVAVTAAWCEASTPKSPG